MGYVSYERASEVLREGGVGIAPFEPRFISAYADPEKIKDYIRFGCPVLMTDAPEVHKAIQERAAGIVVSYDINEFAEAAILLITDADLYEKLSRNAMKMAEDYEWDNIYNKTFMDTGLLPSRPGLHESD
jgi:glycosyltransferase involved in cell wall biosynthesis